ncbi:hypothetical protein AGMMS50296_8990 [Alphaproteobacteria bacterium]|nr:hypothetical protein AGMMS50296_8990 [Alphaproteobacteria bacterium]
MAHGKKVEKARIIVEPTGGYERLLLRECAAHALFVSCVNPFYVRNFARSKRDLAKTDKIDAKVCAEYGEKRKPRRTIPKEKIRFDLEDFTHRRDVLVQFLKEEKQRLEKDPSERSVESIHKVLACLTQEVNVLDGEIKNLIQENLEAESKILQAEKGSGPQTTAILRASLPELGKCDNRRMAQ